MKTTPILIGIFLALFVALFVAVLAGCSDDEERGFHFSLCRDQELGAKTARYREDTIDASREGFQVDR